MKTFGKLSLQRLTQLLEHMRNVRAVLVGDVCVDMYWSADMTRSRLSRETPHFPLPVVEERYSPGAGGNAAANMAALKPAALEVLGAVGDDWRGMCLKDAFARLGIGADGLVSTPGRFTNAYCKPMRRGYSGEEVEDPRLDFENFTPIPPEAEALLLEKLEAAAGKADVLCVSDQFACGCVTPALRRRIGELAAGGLLTVADSRMRIGEYGGAVLKPNEIECARALGLPDDALKNAPAALLEQSAARLFAQTGSPVCLTVGSRGCMVYDGEGTFVPACPVEPPVDTVGAGDCFLSAFSMALAAGAEPAEAAYVGNLAASVSVKKIGTSGTASSEEIVARLRSLEGTEGMPC